MDTMKARDAGWIICPQCRGHLLRMTADTEARALPVYCRRCKREYLFDIERGRSARRRSPDA